MIIANKEGGEGSGNKELMAAFFGRAYSGMLNRWVSVAQPLEYEANNPKVVKLISWQKKAAKMYALPA